MHKKVSSLKLLEHSIMGFGRDNIALLLGLMFIGAQADNNPTFFHDQGEAILGHDFCHLIIDLDLNNITQEVADLVHTTEKVIKIVADDNVKPYLTGHLNLLRSVKTELEHAFSGLVLIIRTSLASVSDVSASQHLLHHRPDLVLANDGMTLEDFATKLNLNLTMKSDTQDHTRKPRGAALLSSIVALGTSIFGLLDLHNVAQRVNRLEDEKKHIGMMMRRQDLLATKALNVSSDNRRVIMAMIEQTKDFTQDNQQITAIQLLISTHTILTRAVDQLATGIRVAQDGKMSPHLLDQEVLTTLHYKLTQRVEGAHYHLVPKDFLSLMKSPVTLVGHSTPTQGYSLPPIQLLVHVPITRSKPFTLLRYIDVPIHSQPPNTFISYQTKGYLAFERSLKTFVELNQEDLDQCTKMLSTWLCPHVKVVNSGVKPCLMALYNNEDHEKACPTKVEHGTFNLKSLTPGLYLLTTLEPILLTYHFVDHTKKAEYVNCEPGSHYLQLNDSIEFVSSTYFHIKGTMKKTIDVEQHLTKRALGINLQDFNIQEDHSHTHPLLTPIDVNGSDFDVLAPTARLSHDHHFIDGLSLGRGAFVTLTLLAVVASTGYLCYRCCQRKKSKHLTNSHGCCGSITSTEEMKPATFQVTAPGVFNEEFRGRSLPMFHHSFQETAPPATSGPENPPQEQQPPIGEPSSADPATQTGAPASPDFSCGQPR